MYKLKYRMTQFIIVLVLLFAWTGIHAGPFQELESQELGQYVDQDFYIFWNLTDEGGDMMLPQACLVKKTEKSVPETMFCWSPSNNHWRNVITSNLEALQEKMKQAEEKYSQPDSSRPTPEEIEQSI